MPGRGFVLADSEYPCMIITEIIESSILVYILLFTQTPNGTIIDSRIIPVTMYLVAVLGYDWWLCMMINISIHHSGRILPDN